MSALAREVRRPGKGLRRAAAIRSFGKLGLRETPGERVSGTRGTVEDAARARRAGALHAALARRAGLAASAAVVAVGADVQALVATDRVARVVRTFAAAIRALLERPA